MDQSFFRYADLPITDSHEHIEVREPLEQTIKDFKNSIDFFGYDRILLLSIFELLEVPVDPLNDYKSLAVKQALFPKVYVYSSLHRYYDERDTAESFLNQVRSAWEAGFDGLKLFECKPKYRKLIGYGIDNMIYEPMFDYMEKEQIPITMHCADPAYFWDGKGISPERLKELIRRDWLYDASFPTRHQLFEEVNKVMERHPKLRLTIAHLMCDEESVTKATEFLEKYPNTGFDLTAAEEEYEMTSKDPVAWRAFFLRFQDRLTFGTDFHNGIHLIEELKNTWGYKSNHISRRYLESSTDYEKEGNLFCSLQLPKEVYQKIYKENLMKKLSEMPRRIQPDKVKHILNIIEKELKEGAYGQKCYECLAEDLENLHQISSQIEKAE